MEHGIGNDTMINRIIWNMYLFVEKKPVLMWTNIWYLIESRVTCIEHTPLPNLHSVKVISTEF